MPTMRHAETKQAIEVSPAQVPLYKSQGWKTGTAAAKKGRPPKIPTPATEPPTPQDSP